jgi:hypothetical protein
VDRVDVWDRPSNMAEFNDGGYTLSIRGRL